MEFKKVGVCGLGLMGHGIAQVAAQAGYDVVAREVDDGLEADVDRAVREHVAHRFPRAARGTGMRGGGRHESGRRRSGRVIMRRHPRAPSERIRHP